MTTPEMIYQETVALLALATLFVAVVAITIAISSKRNADKNYEIQNYRFLEKITPVR